jgi:hypothetical protein
MEERRLRAEARDYHRKNRTDIEQLALLDVRLGVGVGAKRERARLTARITKFLETVAAEPEKPKKKRK